MASLSSARYGKDLVRVFRIVRNSDGTQDVVEYTVCALLEGEISRAYTHSDNKPVVTTDAIKNTIYVKAKTSPHVLQAETFALELATHFVTRYSHIHKAHVDIVKHKWSRIAVAGQPHKHSFVRDGEEKRTVSVTVHDSLGKNNLQGTINAGVKDLLVLKSSGSSFEDFWTDEYTTLPPVNDRIFSTAVDCSYTIPLPASLPLTFDNLSKLGIDFEHIWNSMSTATLETFATHNSASVQATLYEMCQRLLREEKHVEEVSYKLPNKHYFAVDMEYINLKNLKPQDAEVFMPVSHPSGYIWGTVSRDAKAKL
ncbi:putative urate oxidase [Meredithblackwellia eburnea MCA 4105]